MLAMASRINILPMLWWYKFQYFLAFDSLFGRARKAIIYKNKYTKSLSVLTHT